MKRIRNWYNKQDEHEKSAVPLGIALLAVVPFFALILWFIKYLS